MLAYPVSAALPIGAKSKLYKIAHREDISVSKLVRKILVKALSEYEEVDEYDN